MAASSCRIAIIALSLTSLAQAQRGGGGAQTPPANVETEDGIPVTDALVISKCGTCHAKDAKGNLSRISWERATPEGWEEAIKRMVRLNGLTLTPVEGRSVLKYLATYHGLAPEEAKPVMYMPEHRMVDETNIPNDSVRTACTTCHAMGRPLSWRRSKNDWRLLGNLHVALYAQAEAHFRRSLMPGAGGAGAGGGGGGRAAPAATATPGAPATPPAPEPLDAALEFLGPNAALHTPEWAAWRARMSTPKLAGRWLVSATIPGHGKYFGDMVVEPGAAEDEFKTRVKLRSVKDGSTLTRTGQGLIYAGYAWRGRSKGAATAAAAPDDPSREMREAVWFSPDRLHAEGRWFWGEYQEFGADVKLERASTEPTLAGVDRSALKAGATGMKVRIIGDSLPAQIAPADLDFGAGVKVAKVVSHTAAEVIVEVDVAADAVPGKRDLLYRRSLLPGAVAVYDRIDYIKVTPESALARLGSDVHPKGYQQFEAIGYQRGADGKLHTADDVELGPIEVTWKVEEFMAVYGDDDKDFVGHLSPTALFTPASDGPNPERRFGRNNYGDVWVVATAKDEKDKDGKPLSGRSYLVVTVPTYIRWDQPEVEK
jgi:quinohemoprotein amine dehydrogenase